MNEPRSIHFSQEYMLLPKSLLLQPIPNITQNYLGQSKIVQDLKIKF